MALWELGLPKGSGRANVLPTPGFIPAFLHQNQVELFPRNLNPPAGGQPDVCFASIGRERVDGNNFI